MTNELTKMSGTELAIPPLPGGKAVESINGPLRVIASVMKTAAQCTVDIDELQAKKDKLVSTNEMLRRKSDEVYHIVNERGERRASSSEASHAFTDLVHYEGCKLTREMLLPRFTEVQEAYALLNDICTGGHDIDAPTAFKMIGVLHRVLAKKKDDPVSLAAFVTLFDPDVDSLGPSLGLWKEVPRHPIIVALGIQYLFHHQTFAPAPVEFISACHRAGNVLKARYRQTTSWLYSLSTADAEVYEKDPDLWASAYADTTLTPPVLGWYYLNQEIRKKQMDERDVAVREMMEKVNG